MTKIGKYEIHGELGHGAFGKVYRAFNPAVQCPVAIKELTAGSTPDVMQRFRNEATAAGNLHHKNIVTIHDFFEENGIPYIVMEVLEGNDLQQVLRDAGRLGLLEKVQIMTQVAEGLSYAHQHHVVHRDVKPANIMILANGSVKIMDFGIARVLGEDVTRQTMTGYVLGTPAYMCPEQIEGGEVDWLADIWAYGVIYYELLSGRHPFKAGDHHATMFRIVNTDPPPLRSVAPDCPEALAAIVHHALAKDRSARYQSMEDILLDTGPILAELERERAASLLIEGNSLFAAGQLDDAESAVRRSLDLDRGNPEAQRLRKAIADEKRRRTVRPRIEGYLRSGEDAMARRQFEEALAAFEAAHRLDQTDTAIRVRLDTANAAIEQSKRANALLAEAQAGLAALDLTVAYQRAGEAVRVDPQNTEAGRMIESIRAAIEKRETERRIQEVVDKARGLMMIEAYDDAVALLHELQIAHPDSHEIAELAASAAGRKARRDEARRLRACIDGVRDLLRDRRFADAAARMETAVKDFGEAPELVQLLSFTREQLQVEQRGEAIRQIAAGARSLIAGGKYADALEALKRGIDTWGGESTLVVLVQTAQNEQAAFLRHQEIDEAVRRAQDLRGAEKFREARESLDAALAKLGAEPALLELGARLDEEWKAWQRADALRQALQEARNLVARGQPTVAITLLEKTAADFPSEPEIAKVLQAARQSRDELEELRFVQEQLAAAVPLERAGQISGALKIVETAIQRYPGSAELAAARARLQEAMREAERQQRVSAYRRQIDDQLRSGRIERGLQLAEKAASEFPGERSLADLRERALSLQRQAEVDVLAARARESLDRGEVDEHWELPQVLRQAPETPDLKDLKLRVEKEKTYRSSMASAQSLLNQKQWKGAEQMAQKALEARPRDAAAESILQTLHAERAAEERRKACAEGRFEAGRLVRSHDFEKALNVLGELLARYPGEADVQRDWESALAAREQQQRELGEQQAQQARREGREQVRQLVARQDLEGAQQKLDALLLQFPGDPELERDRQQVVQARARQVAQERERQEPTRAQARPAAAEAREPVRREQDLAEQRARQMRAEQRIRAQDLASRHLVDEALEITRRLLQQFPGDTELERDRQRYLAAREQRNRTSDEQRGRKALAEGREQARQLVSRQQYAAAAQKLEALAARFPGDAELAAECQRAVAARDQQIRLQGREQFRQLMARQDLDRALEHAEALLAQFPDDRELRRDKKMVLAARERRDQERVAQGARQLRAQQRIRAQGLFAQQQFDAALEVTEDLLKQFPGDAELEQDRENIARARDKQAREATAVRARQARAEGRRQARQLQVERQYAPAVKILDRLCAQFPGDPELEQERQQLVAARDQYEREMAPQRALQLRAEARLLIQQLVATSQFDAALEKLDGLLIEYPDDAELERDRQMVEAARQRYARPAPSTPSPVPEPQSPSISPPDEVPEPAPGISRLRIILIAALAAAIVIAVGAYFLTRG
jgi:serine/threonine-protein kinase